MAAAVLAGVFLLISGSAGAGDSDAAANWPQWRGARGQGVAEEKGYPVRWSATENLRWKTAIPGDGHSSPIVWGDRVFLTSTVRGEQLPEPNAIKHQVGGKDFTHPDWVGSDYIHAFKVIALDRRSGGILWERTAYEGKVYDHRHRRGSYAAGTPATDGQRVYVYFGSEGLYCYDFEGKLVWQLSLGGIATLGMGTGTSPILHENLLILQCDQDMGENSFIVAIDKATGKEVWRTARKVQVSWSTPVLVSGPNGTELVTTGNEWIISYEPATGRELWRSGGVKSNAIPSPLVQGERVFVSAGFPTKRTFAIRTGGSGDITGSSSILWTYDKGTAYVPSGILYDGLLYLLSDKGILTCMNPETGEVLYEDGRVPVAASFIASPVAFEGKILLSSEDGDVFVVSAGPKHEILQTNSLGEPIRASPALSHGQIFIRGEKHLFCLENQSK